MTWTAAPALTAILHDADRVAPGRSHASDGTIGDAAHSASVSDHNPDSRGVVHACDVTNDPAHGFDSWHWAQVVADRMKAGDEKRVKYLVSNDGSKDVIWNPAVANFWRPNLHNGATQQDHRSHLHVSIEYTTTAENDTSPFFVSSATPAPPTPEQDDFLAMLSPEAQIILVANVADLHKLHFQATAPGPNPHASMLHDIEAAIDASRITTADIEAALDHALSVHPPKWTGKVNTKAVAEALAADLAGRLSS